ncbi:MAG TPA: hypothetical protein VKS60_16955 [Stellaceae bacterium]|nr:hypothetical protein [Stellaceae bacterium]
MILSPIAPDDIDTVLARYRATLPETGTVRAVFERIAASLAAPGPDEAIRHRDAVALTNRFGMAPLDEPPERGFSWDGARVRTVTEPAVLIHEVAHYQLASPARRQLPDFGLGAGPETGCVAEADRSRVLGDAAREIEEQMASLLGVLWEVELGHPGIEAFQEQNWLEGAGRAGTARFFAETLARLINWQVVDAAGRPLETVRIRPDA